MEKIVGASRVKRSILDDLIEEEPELHHYTTFGGLKGIIESNSLWATHFLHTNDATEFTLVHSYLVKRVAALLTETLDGFYRGNQSFRDLANQVSGTFECFVKDNALGAVDALYSIDIGTPTIDRRPPEDGAFVTCFCAHNRDSDFTRQNGLLSQWRGYTGATKFCIVFDTKELVRLARHEANRHLWRFISFDRVRYVDSELSLGDDFYALAVWLARMAAETMTGHKFSITELKDSSEERLFAPLGPLETFLSCATQIKHQAFSEEREVRMVAVRAGPATLDRAPKPIREAKPKSLRFRSGEGKKIPYLAMFEDLGEPLPIKRIIVGPSRDQEEQNRRAQAIAPTGTPIVNSSIPYVG